MAGDLRRAYWRRNLGYLAVLLAVWFSVSLGAGVLFVDELDRVRIGGFPLGFWFSQQGAIYVFIALIFVYVALMNRLDRKFGVGDRARDETALAEEFSELESSAGDSEQHSAEGASSAVDGGGGQK